MNKLFGAAALLLGIVMADAAAQGARYVSMGSSYAAGPGVGTRDAASRGCDRSLSNYARTVAARHHLDLVDVACSGATTDNILAHGQHGFAPQVEAVTPDTRLVSILIGGNDIAYVGNLFGLSCRAAGGSTCQVVDDAGVDRRLADLPAALDRVVDAVRRRAPKARIVLVGYLPAVAAADPGTCAALPLAPADARRMRDTTARLTDAFEQAAARHRIDVIHAAAIGAQHAICAAEPYVTGYRPAREPGWPAPVAYHPNQAGMDGIAAAFDAILGQQAQ
ncbi:SGNH/GDSL hydrolase family protein [Massilia phyllosphaerae]|uniref:SGNH/GDSL hydrolase family protein n=1 Tax=Massilia phyllosphaerae TaxID=3106034 RepID=UPI002B1CBCF4|nr:SGNH/GDSL hydrolase family protein [Massilia sp. SGZ-792]